MVLRLFHNRIWGFGGGGVPRRKIVVNCEFIANCLLVCNDKILFSLSYTVEVSSEEQ